MKNNVFIGFNDTLIISILKLFLIDLTCKKFELLALCDGECNVGTARARISATETWGDPNPVLKPYSISWNTLKQKIY